jgi:hypothetical protein
MADHIEPPDVAAQESDDFTDAIREAEKARQARKARLEELEQMRGKLLEEAEEQREEEHLLYLEQEIDDRKRQRELEREHGYNRVLAVPFSAWKPGVGAATRFVVLLPDARTRQFKIMQRAIARLKDDREEQVEEVERLARNCVRYPHPERDRQMFEATANLAPGIMGNLAKQIIEKVAGREVDTRKK